MQYKKFRIKEYYNGEYYSVEVRGLFFWKSGYAYTNYFVSLYKTKAEAVTAIENYKNRFTPYE